MSKTSAESAGLRVKRLRGKRVTALTRFAFVVVGLGGWYLTQSWIGQRELMPGAIGDGVHDWLAGANSYLHAHPHRTDQLLIASSAVIDLLGLFLLWRSIFGPSLRPFLGLLVLFGMRQICQVLCALEPPPGMIWRDPGFPSLFVTYGVTTDFFFSGHTGLAVLGAVEIARLGGRRWLLLGAAIVVFEVATVLVLRAHYTMDVFTGAVAARYATMLATRVAPPCDRFLGRLVGQVAPELGAEVPDAEVPDAEVTDAEASETQSSEASPSSMSSGTSVR